MPMYLIPPVSDEAADTLAIIARSGAHFVQARQAGDVVRSERDGIVVCAVNSVDLAIIMRHALQLLQELPTAVVAVPGLLYSAEWSMLAASLPHVDWRELEAKLLKSGLLANDLKEVESRSKFEPQQTQARGVRALAAAAKSVRPADDSDDEAEHI